MLSSAALGAAGGVRLTQPCPTALQETMDLLKDDQGSNQEGGCEAGEDTGNTPIGAAAAAAPAAGQPLPRRDRRQDRALVAAGR